MIYSCQIEIRLLCRFAQPEAILKRQIWILGAQDSIGISFF